jgi:hypothetical protein
MEKLVEAAITLAKAAGEVLPGAEFRVCSISQLEPISRTLALSPAMLAWYTTLAPYQLSIPLIGNPLVLYSPLDLIARQEGYRWRGGDTQRKVQAGWEPAWVVMGDIGADPVIAHTNFPETPVSGALHGTGSWDLKLIAPTLASFLESMTVLIHLLDTFGGENGLTNEESEPREEVLTYLRDNLWPVIGLACAENFIGLTFG